MKKDKNLPKLVPAKKKRNTDQKPVDNSNEIKRLIQIILVIVVIFFVVYGLTLLIKEKRSSNNNEENIVEIQYKDILLGNLFNQNYKEYYVLVTTDEDNYKDLYNVYLSINDKSKNSQKIYTSNLSNSFNLKYKGEETNVKITNIEDLKLKTSTLIKVKDKKISNVYEGKEKIVEQLKLITK
ncbi:MAG: hypothetical protein PHO63_00255 [Bacilli bacterium]|nr:hypothetical protein [Bacilli bacterium]MDD4808698.1 hypothetical protein [Bacilli bacterium]